MIERTLNFRPFMHIFIHTAISIWIYILSYYSPVLSVIAYIVQVGVIAIFCVLAIDNCPKRLVTFALAFVLAGSMPFIINMTLTKWDSYYALPYVVSGRVTEDIEIGIDDTVIILDNLTIKGDEADGKMKVSVPSTSDNSVLECGFYITFETDIYTYSVIDDSGVNASYALNDIIYHAYPTSISIASYTNPTILENARLTISDTLFTNMPYDEASVAYGMLLGDRSYISSDISAYFSSGGIGHILAVSGLHIGVLVMAILLLLRLVRFPKRYRALVCIAVLIFYAILTGGSASVIRALIMTTISLASTYFFAKPDLLNSLCVAGCVCLLISPFYIFDIGFIMSFCAVLGIALLSPILRRALVKIKLPEKVCDILSITFAVQIGILPCLIYFFSSIYLYSIIVNCIMLPLLSAIYVATFASMILTLIMPFCSFLLLFTGYAIGGIVLICAFVSTLPFAYVLTHNSVLVFLIIPFLFLASDYVMLSRIKKLLCYCLSAIAVLVIPIATECSVTYTNSMLTMSSGDSVVFSDSIYLIGDISSYASYNLLDAGITSDIIVMPNNMNEETATNIIKLSRIFNISNVIIGDDVNATGIDTLYSANINFTITNYYNNFIALYDENDMLGWLYTYMSDVVIFAGSEYSTPADSLADIIIRNYTYSAYYDANYICKYDNDLDYSNVYSTMANGNVLYDFATKDLIYT